ncbi:MAG TPA: hypothetical protein VL860_01955, partial [Planctomycetota bacterium]|nr:hypothetical protein [Planctomycetota bacterium]
EKLSAEERGRRCARLYLACQKFMPLNFYSEHKAKEEKEAARVAAEQKKAEQPGQPNSPSDAPAPAVGPNPLTAPVE